MIHMQKFMCHTRLLYPVHEGCGGHVSIGIQNLLQQGQHLPKGGLCTCAPDGLKNTERGVVK